MSRRPVPHTPPSHADLTASVSTWADLAAQGRMKYSSNQPADVVSSAVQGRGVVRVTSNTRTKSHGETSYPSGCNQEWCGTSSCCGLCPHPAISCTPGAYRNA